MPGPDADPNKSVVYGYDGTLSGAGDAMGITICNVSQGDSVYCVKQLNNNGKSAAATYAQRKGVSAEALASDLDAFSSKPWQN